MTPEVTLKRFRFQKMVNHGRFESKPIDRWYLNTKTLQPETGVKLANDDDPYRNRFIYMAEQLQSIWDSHIGQIKLDKHSIDLGPLKTCCIMFTPSCTGSRAMGLRKTGNWPHASRQGHQAVQDRLLCTYGLSPIEKRIPPTLRLLQEAGSSHGRGLLSDLMNGLLYRLPRRPKDVIRSGSN